MSNEKLLEVLIEAGPCTADVLMKMMSVRHGWNRHGEMVRTGLKMLELKGAASWRNERNHRGEMQKLWEATLALQPGHSERHPRLRRAGGLLGLLRVGIK